jgi:integrase
MRHPKKWEKIIRVSLDAYEHETRKAQINLGKVLQDLERGIDPVSARLRIRKIKIEGKIPGRTKQILKQHIYPFFGDYRPREINKELIEKYMIRRWGKDESGGLQGVESTLDKELGALRLVLNTVDSGYKLPALNYTRIEREILEDLTIEQVHYVADFIPEKYKDHYWIMALTGMDVSDACYLKPCHFTKAGWIDKPRGKVEYQGGERICVPVLERLKDILKKSPWPFDKQARLFPDIKPKAVTTALLRAFNKAGLKGYGAKYLRRYIGAMLTDLNYGDEFISKVLAHSEGSRMTKRYTRIYKATAEEAFKKIDERGNNVATRLSKSE